jgi:hypothetical protein
MSGKQFKEKRIVSANYCDPIKAYAWSAYESKNHKREYIQRLGVKVVVKAREVKDAATSAKA